jgi:hypothetical protein
MNRANLSLILAFGWGGGFFLPYFKGLREEWFSFLGLLLPKLFMIYNLGNFH